LRGPKLSVKQSEDEKNFEDLIMAEMHATGGHPAMDYAEHERTYRMFISVSKWATIAVCALMVFMAVTLL
jgi:hypothetical protein